MEIMNWHTFAAIIAIIGVLFLIGIGVSFNFRERYDSIHKYIWPLIGVSIIVALGFGYASGG